MLSSFVIVLICLALSYFISEFLKRFGIPRVVAYLSTGIILGASFLRPDIFSSPNVEVVEFLANLGIVLLFYYVGLEMDFQGFTRNFKRSVLVSLLNTLIPLAIGFLVMHFVLKFDYLQSFVVGMALSVSSQAVSVELLEELGLLKSKIGSLLVGAGAVDDLLELLLVTLVLSFFNFAVSGFTFSSLLFYLLIFLLFVVFARVWLVPMLLKFFDVEKSSTYRFMGSLVIVLLLASLSDLLGVGAFIGAIAAGIIIRQTIFKGVSFPHWEEHDIARSIHIVAFGFLIPFFSIWAGLNVDLNSAVENFGLVLFFFLIATVGTIGGTVLAIALSKGSLRQGFIVGWGLNAKGDVELVIATIALKSGLIGSGVFSAIVVMSLLTTLISPIVFRHLVTRFVKRELS